MTDTDILKRYAIVTLGTMIALALLTLLVQRFFGIGIGTGTGIVTAILPAMDAGQTYARRAGGTMGSQRMWRVALLGTLINFGIGGWLVMGAAAVSGISVASLLAALGTGIVLAITAAIFVAYLLAARFFIGLGQRGEIKRQS